VDYTVIAGEGVLSNTVTATNEGGTDTSTGTDESITASVLSLEKAPAYGQPLIVKMGDKITYTITIRNNGTVTSLQDVLIEEELAGEWSEARGFDLPSSVQPDNSLRIAVIKPGVSLKVNFTTVAGKGTLTNTVRGTSSGGPEEASDSSIKGGILDISKAPKTGQPLVVQTGEPIVYTVTIRNLSATTELTGVTVTEDIPGGMTGGTWSNAVGFTLPNGEATLTVDYTVAATEGTNHNTVSATDDGGGDTPNTDSGSDDSFNGGILDVSKAPAADQALTVQKGDKVTYTITIRNLATDSDDKLSDVKVIEQMSGGTWSNPVGFNLDNAKQLDGSLLISEISGADTLTVDYSVTADEGVLMNTVTVEGESDDGSNGDEDSDDSITASIIALSKEPAAGQPRAVKEGDEVTFHITATNTGTTELDEVTVFEGMPGTWSNYPEEATVNGWTLSVPALAEDEELSADYTVTAGEGPLVNVIGTADYDGYGPNSAVALNFEVMAGTLFIDKTVAAQQPTSVRAGDPVTYRITIRNTATSELMNAPEVLITEQTSGGTWSDAQGFDLPGADSEGQLKKDSFVIEEVPFGSEWTVDYTVAAGEGQLHNGVSIANYNGTGTDTDTGSDDSVTAGVLSVEKLPAAGQPLNVEKGDAVVYTIRIHNAGTTHTATNVAVVESMEGKWSDAIDFDLGAAQQQDGSLLIPEVAPGATLSVNYTVVAGVGTIANTVSIADGGGGGSDTGTSTNTDVFAGSLAVDKALAPGQAAQVKKGDPVAYHISLRNIGSGPLSDVLVSEDLAGSWSNATGFDLASAKQADGKLLIANIAANSTLTVDFTIKASEGTITNTVSAQDNNGSGNNGDSGKNSDASGTPDPGPGPGPGPEPDPSPSPTPKPLLPASGDVAGPLQAALALALLALAATSIALSRRFRRQRK
jgi:uncharacterized repeat protein (TIGR01451 family)